MTRSITGRQLGFLPSTGRWLLVVVGVLVGWAAAAPAQESVVVRLVPAVQAAMVGDVVALDVRLDVGARGVGAGGVFLQFDGSRLAFRGGELDEGTWDLSFVNTEPNETQPGIVAFALGSAEEVHGSNVLVATLRFLAIGGGATQLEFLFRDGAEQTVFSTSDFSTTLPTSGIGAMLQILGPTATPTATPTVTPTATASPSATATAAAPAPCVGDCSADVAVTVDEILFMVGVALGSSSVEGCARGDGNEDGEITVDEILGAVQNALAGCPVSDE